MHPQSSSLEKLGSNSFIGKLDLELWLPGSLSFPVFKVQKIIMICKIKIF